MKTWRSLRLGNDGIAVAEGLVVEQSAQGEAIESYAGNGVMTE
jgi:hypothetical protein